MLAGAALLLGLGLTLGVPVSPDSRAAGRSSAPSQDGRLFRALELRDASEFYHHDGRNCRKCPPGTHVSVHCSLGTEGTCLPCPDDTFVQHQNQYETCFNCKSCRLLDEEMLKPCTKTSDTQCACKNGTFCAPSLPCETCSKCTSRCPDGEAMVRPCTPASDIQCEKSSTVAPPTASGPAAGSGVHSITWIILGLLLGLLLAVLVFVCKKKGRDRGPESRTATCSSGTIQRLKRKFNLQQSDDQDNKRNERVDQESQHMLPIQGEASPAAPWPQKESSVTERHLVPQNGRDPLEALRQSFETFIKWVPLKAWKRFMRALGLTDNEIAVAELDEKAVTEQQFQMLRTWLAKQGKAAALRTLLDTLQAIGLQGVVSTVCEELLSAGLYCPEGCLQANPPCTDS